MNTRQPVKPPVTLPVMTGITRQPVTAYICIGGVTGDGGGVISRTISLNAKL
jgi:hypothetical protein